MLFNLYLISCAFCILCCSFYNIYIHKDIMRVFFVSDGVSNPLQFWRSLMERKAHRPTDSFGSRKASICLKTAPLLAQRECYPVGHEALLEASEFTHAGNTLLSVYLYQAWHKDFYSNQGWGALLSLLGIFRVVMKIIL